MEIAFLPKWLFAGMDENRRNHLNHCMSALAVILMIPNLHLLPQICLFRWSTKVPCPGCGITTALAAIFRLDIHGALKANGASVPLAILLAFQVLVRPLGLFSSSLSVGTAIDRCSRF
jgi:hypothetical protein